HPATHTLSLHDALPISGRPRTLEALPAGACIGTSSLRRRALLLDRRPDLDVDDLRGNLDSRLARVREGRYDAIVLALAGLRRLGWEEEVAEVRSEEHTSELQSRENLVCRLLLEKKK